MRPVPRFIPGLHEQLDDLAQSLETDTSPRNVMRVAEAMWLGGSAPRAVELLEGLLRDFPVAIAPRLLLGWCLEDCGRVDEGLHALEAARTLDPANPFLKKERGAHRPETPAETASAAPIHAAEPASAPPRDPEREAEPESSLTPEELRTIPPSPLYSATLGEIFEKQGFDEKAIEIYREVVRLHPEREDLLARIETLEGRVGGEELR